MIKARQKNVMFSARFLFCFSCGLMKARSGNKKISDCSVQPLPFDFTSSATWKKNQFYNSPEDAEIECLIVIPIEFISESGDHILVKYANSASLAQMSLPYVITFCFTAVRKIYFYTRLIV